MMFIHYLLATIVVIAVIGFIVSKLLNIANTRLFEIKNITDELTSSTPWLKALAPLITLFYLLSNLIFWTLFGFEQLLVLVLLLMGWVKQFFLWIWRIILNPTIVFLIKMLWHYPVVFTWKFTRLAFSQIIPSMSFGHLISGAIALLRFLLFVILLYVCDSLIDQTWFTFIAVPFISFAAVYTLITLGLVFSESEHLVNDRKALLTRFSILIVLSSVVSGILSALYFNQDKISVSEFGFPLSEFLIPAFIALLFIIFMSIPFGVAHYVKNKTLGSFSDYTKELLLRLPKLIYSLPFQTLGMMLVMFLPAIIYLTLDRGINLVTGASVDEHQSRVAAFSDIDNDYSTFSDKIDFNKIQILKIDSTLMADSVSVTLDIAELNLRKEVVNAAKSSLSQKEIFHLDDEFYSTESQIFSFPPVLNCETFSWEIVDSDDKVVARKDKVADAENSSVFVHTWKEAGSYTITVIPENSCEKGDQYFTQVIVSEMPSPRSEKLRIIGPNSLCSGDTVVYRVNDSYSSYMWLVPPDASIIEGIGTNKINVIWGTSSGVVALKGSQKNESSSKYSILEVAVVPGLDIAVSESYEYPTEAEDFVIPMHSFAFYDLNNANDSLQRLDEMIADLELTYKEKREETSLYISALLLEIDDFESRQSDLIILWFSNLFGMIGLLLLALLSIPAFSYFFKYNFSLYSFEEDGAVYLLEELNALKTKDERQPLFGWFILVVIGAVLTLISGVTSFELRIPEIKIISQNFVPQPVVSEPIQIDKSKIQDSTAYRIQVYRGQIQFATEFRERMTDLGVSCDLVVSKDESYRVLTTMTFPNAKSACEEVEIIRGLNKQLEGSFVVTVIDGFIQSFEMENCKTFK